MLRELQQQQVAIQPQQVQQQFLAHSLVQLNLEHQAHQAHLRFQRELMAHEVSLTSQAQQVREDHHLQVAHHPQVAHQPQPAVKVAQQVDYLDSLVQHQR
jgi:hypothetical protein